MLANYRIFFFSNQSVKNKMPNMEVFISLSEEIIVNVIPQL